MKAATTTAGNEFFQYTFQSTPPVKAATYAVAILAAAVGISIHAAREGGDGEKGKNCESSRISIHAAREGGDVSA